MKKILKITSSFRGEDSFSTKLADAVVEKLMTSDPESSVKTMDLTDKPFPHLDELHFNSFFTPESDRSEEMKEAVKPSGMAIEALMDADIVVIGVAMYNFGIPSALKAWVDHIARAGITFKYSGNGPEGLVKNKKVYLCIATGGIYSKGDMKSFDFTETYLRTVLGFLGMVDITAFRVEGINVSGIKETALEKAIENITI